MQFNRHEYALLSRRGSVPAALRAERRPVPESEPWQRPASDAPRASGRAGLARGASRVRAGARSGLGTARAFQSSVRATWTAFGAGGQDGFRER